MGLGCAGGPGSFWGPGIEVGLPLVVSGAVHRLPACHRPCCTGGAASGIRWDGQDTKLSEIFNCGPIHCIIPATSVPAVYLELLVFVNIITITKYYKT